MTKSSKWVPSLRAPEFVPLVVKNPFQALEAVQEQAEQEEDPAVDVDPATAQADEAAGTDTANQTSKYRKQRKGKKARQFEKKRAFQEEIAELREHLHQLEEISAAQWKAMDEASDLDALLELAPSNPACAQIAEAVLHHLSSAGSSSSSGKRGG